MALFEGSYSVAGTGGLTAPGVSVWISLAAFILAILAAYAWHLHRRLKALEDKQQCEALEAETRRQQQKDDATQGIRILAGAMIREELTLTEGCMRIAYLLPKVDEAAHSKDQYSVFFQLASATSHIPVLDAWKALPSQQKNAYTKERATIEEAFESFVMEAVQELLKEPLFSPR